MGMAHRGRLNVLTNILEKPAEEIFSEFESCYDPQDLVGSGDVKYHIGYLTGHQMADGDAHFPCIFVSNPSHLEAVDPVVEGICPGPAGSHWPVRRRSRRSCRCCCMAMRPLPARGLWPKP